MSPASLGPKAESSFTPWQFLNSKSATKIRGLSLGGLRVIRLRLKKGTKSVFQILHEIHRQRRQHNPMRKPDGHVRKGVVFQNPNEPSWTVRNAERQKIQRLWLRKSK
jgi:RecB family exonuclease